MKLVGHKVKLRGRSCENQAADHQELQVLLLLDGRNNKPRQHEGEIQESPFIVDFS
jgi:hypothetical protein